MISDQILFIAGIIVTVILVLGFFFTAYEFNQLDENDDIHYRHKDTTKVKFKE